MDGIPSLPDLVVPDRASFLLTNDKPDQCLANHFGMDSLVLGHKQIYHHIYSAVDTLVPTFLNVNFVFIVCFYRNFTRFSLNTETSASFVVLMYGTLYDV